MITRYHIVRDVAKRIAEAADRSVIALREGRVEQEPAFTDRMLGAIEESLDGFVIKGIRWRAKTLTDHGRGAQELTYGADFMGVLNLELPEISVSKGFLAQAKLIRRSKVDDLGELKQQCEKMLNFSPESYVFLYRRTGIRIVSALAVTESKVDPWELSHRSVQRFFEEHLQCFFGDRRIQAPIPDTLAALKERAEARSAILLEASPDTSQGQ